MDYFHSGEDEDDPEMDIHPSADFLMSTIVNGKEWRSSWYEAPTEYAHAYGACMSGSTRLTIEQVHDEQQNAPIVKDGYEYEQDLEAMEEEFDNVQYDCLWVREREYNHPDKYVEDPEYVCQFWSVEKGTFFEGTISITDEADFDPSKLYFKTQEYPNGDDIIHEITYDGAPIENDGAETNDKGYSDHIWKNLNENKCGRQK